MVFVWIGLGIAVLVAAILLKKIIKTPPQSAITFNQYCKKCGYRTNGLKCPRCQMQSSQKWK
jgi:predicted Zn-ribbon and HTH transcriptional regulator